MTVHRAAPRPSTGLFPTADIRSAAEWVAAWKSADPRLAPYHASLGWQLAPRALEPRARGLSAPEIAEWRGFLEQWCPPSATQPLEQLADPATLVVVTGQQAGAALGPLYVLWKALAARWWAGEVTRRTGRPCLPIFWVASDDHDLEEVRTAAWMAHDGTIATAPVAMRATAPRAVWREPVDPALADAFLHAIEGTTKPTPHREAVLADLAAALTAPGATLESQFLSLAARWLVPLGILPVVPRLSFLRHRAVPLLRAEIANAGASSESVRAIGAEMGALGVTPPLHRQGDEVNFFVEVEQIRAKVTRAGDRLHLTEPGTNRLLGDLTPREMEELLLASPGRFSPNAILRPLVQDAALPVAAYIGGPSEVLYHAQLGALYQQFGVVRPAIIPRPAVALVEPRQARAAEKIGLPLDQIDATSPDALSAQIDAMAGDDEALRAVEAASRRLEEALEATIATLLALGPDTAVRRAAEKLDESTRQGLNKALERARHYSATRDSDRAAARQRLLEALFPGGHAQERAIGPVAPLLLQHGPGILADIAAAINYTAPRPQVLNPATMAIAP